MTKNPDTERALQMLTGVNMVLDGRASLQRHDNWDAWCVVWRDSDGERTNVWRHNVSSDDLFQIHLPLVEFGRMLAVDMLRQGQKA